MLAIDQRESLRGMFSAVSDGASITDGELTSFKMAVAEVLGGAASAILLDRLFGLPAAESARDHAPDCGLILAIDELRQASGGPVTDTTLDASVDLGHARSGGFVAAKLLVIWSTSSEDRGVALAHEFVARCRAAGVSSVLEAIVQPEASGDRETEIVRAAAALGTSSPDLYKCEVPFLGDATPSKICTESERISNALDCPWVVLSSGVGAERFPTAVEHACRGGASGFLAGRAVWADAIGRDYRSALKEISLPRMHRLAAIVDEHARPWHDVVAQR
jgi:sulfofructosephosphate aldolase